ncbi:hypothetical protein L6452_08698 [Arctium lappa]|uniref:Uncharacterized protein n=1 Tax=Arctium lappa TaxID=4217 RepID=A0ACB9DI74_ARCLA|nr:hypothetical protein L6452_08698 [Arctium lappa]
MEMFEKREQIDLCCCRSMEMFERRSMLLKIDLIVCGEGADRCLRKGEFVDCIGKGTKFNFGDVANDTLHASGIIALKSLEQKVEAEQEYVKCTRRSGGIREYGRDSRGGRWGARAVRE